MYSRRPRRDHRARRRVRRGLPAGRSRRCEADLLRAELIAFPITLLLMVLVFGSVVAAGLPLLVGALAIVGTFLVLLVVAALTRGVDLRRSTSPPAMGLGLGDRLQPLHRVALPGGAPERARAERRGRPHGPDRREDGRVQRAHGGGLRSPRCSCSRSRSCGRSPTPASAWRCSPAIAAVVALPALLAVLGPRVDSLRLLRRDPKPVGEGVWHRVAMFVMRRPVPVAVRRSSRCSSLLGLPFLRIQFGLPDDRVLADQRRRAAQVQDDIRSRFASQRGRARSRWSRRHRRSSRADVIRSTRTPPRCRSAAASPASTPLTGSYVSGQQVAGPGPMTARVRSPRRDVAVGRPVGRAVLATPASAGPRRARHARRRSPCSSAATRPSSSTPRRRCSRGCRSPPA